MAPILKEADAPVTTAATTTTAPVAKSPNEVPVRPQPVPLEIPVTVNGARTVEGSEKREPFAETTQTVLVFPHGAVIRIATPLAPGQLVFLTNEKTKKEVVCQVVKSKSGGSTNGYVELQFTEPAPAFWGLRLPSTMAAPPATAPAVPRPVVTTPSPKAITAAPPVAQVSVPATPVAVPPAPPAAPVIKPTPPAPTQSVAPAVALPVSIAPPPASPRLPEPAPLPPSVPVAAASGAPLSSIPPPSPIGSEPVSSPIHKVPSPLIPPAPAGPRDYSREIESLFAVPQAPKSATARPAAPAVLPPPPVASSPSTEELKLQAARLQEQLSSVLFTEAPAAPVNPPLESKLESPIADVTDKTLEIAQQELRPVTESAAKADLAPESKPEIRPEPKPVAPPRPPVFSSLSAKDEEVEIPAWLRPLAQHSETAETPAAPSEATQLVSSEFAASTAQESDSVDFSTRSEVAVFGGQLLAGDSTSETASASGSKKGLFVGLVAAAVLLAAGGAWYYRQTHAAAAPAPQPTHTSTAPVASEPNSVTNASTAPAPLPRPVANASAPSNAANSAPTRTPTPSQAAPAPAPETRRSAETHNSAPLEEPTKKPSLGAVRLASPVVRGSGEGNASGEPLPSIDAHAESSSADPLADVAHHKAPAVPIPVGGDVKPAQLIKSVAPVYPPLAKTQRVTGNVTLDALIDVSGNVAQVKVISGPPLLHQAALEAVKQWKYTPAQLDGNPTSMHLTVTVQFRNQ